jgi:hypothetical protein
LRSRAAIAILTVLVCTASQGCATNDSTEGPPFESRNIESKRSLLLTDSDVDAVGASTPYGSVLRWWQALQLGDAKGVRRSYARPVSGREARRQIDHFRPRFSQPLDPEVEMRRNRSTVDVLVRAATRDEDTPGVVGIDDFSATFRLVQKDAGWRLRAGTYRHYLHSRKDTHTPGPTG